MAEKQRLFDAGYVIRTPSAVVAMREAHVSEWSLLERHASGDYGFVDAGQRRANDTSISTRGQVCSAYRLRQHWLRVVTDLRTQTTTVSISCEGAEDGPA